MAMGTLGVLDPRMVGQGGFEFFLALSTTVFIKWHRGYPFFLYGIPFIEESRSGLDKLTFCKRS
jgi:hypothetical protein